MNKLKQLLIIAFTLVLAVALTACGQKDEKQEHHVKYAPKNATPINKIEIFKSSDKGKDLTEQELEESLKRYLNANNDIIDNKYVLQHKLDQQYDGRQKVSDDLDTDLRDLANLTTKNQMNFEAFLKDNKVPADQKEDIERVNKYFKAVNYKAARADQQLEELSYSPQKTVNVVDVPTNYAGDVNLKQQKKIKAYLKKHHLETKAIDK
ncbi:NDxxF motif lipoprotein [Staphylococcus sp. IVB6181]|uniref:NDxxF motif lipoprotein n=1 Tax=Staphylococcus sp. IVB6181 TaxID=2929481 RepID=UPI0021D066D8|nr:NDxxF motif lipoprotein [Staphylococcus sp. IVB6181]UXV34942.1 NDxxF motif lipoprotein [Staphylococcus sp. IVB6181]